METSDSESGLSLKEVEITKPLEIFKETLNGKKVVFVGVDHDPGYFDAHRQELEKIIQESAIVVPEYFPFEKLQSLQAPLEGPRADKFFWAVSEVARKFNKRIARVDPEAGIQVDIVGGGMIGAGAVALISALQDAAGYIDSKKKFSRRDFLKIGAKTGAKGLAAYSFALSSPFFFPARVIEIFAKGEEAVVKDASEYGIDDKLAYELNNYRNVCVAKGLDELTKNLPEDSGQIAVIYGRAHPKVINSYLKENKVERDIKINLYYPFRLVADQSIRNYEFVEGNWQLSSKEPY